MEAIVQSGRGTAHNQNMKMSKAKILYQGKNELGEGPLWLAAQQQLWWVDIGKRLVYCYDFKTEQVQQFAYERPVTLLVETQQPDTLLVAMQGGIAYLDTRTGAVQPWLTLETDKPNNRTNDGGCDPLGRLWVGTMDMQFETGAGNLYLLDNGRFVPQVARTTIANGLVWAPDGRTMYFIDSPLKTVKSYAFDPADGRITLQGDVVRIPDELGTPDGMAIDEAGMLWVAHYGGYSVGRWNPFNGELLEKIDVPAPNVTACAFGGADMQTLFITTARQEMSPEALAEYPLSGGVFQVNTTVPGWRKHVYP